MAASQAALLELHQYFLTRPETDSAVAAGPGVAQDGTYPGAARYARRGLFSFAKTQLHERADTGYYLVAQPLRPLTVAELPERLAQLLGRTRALGSVAEQTSLDIRAIG